MLEFGERMLHPATILVEFARLLGRMAAALVALLVVRFTGGSGDFLEIFATAFGLFGVVAAGLRYLTVRFSVAQGNLVIRSGILVKQVRTIPLDRIQNINLRRTLLHRWLKVVDLKIETAAGTGAEAELSVLGEADAEALRASMLGLPLVAGAESPDPAPTLQPVLYRAELRELLLAGSTENRFLLIVGSAFSLFFLVRPNQDGAVEQLIRGTGLWYRNGQPLWLVLVGFLVLLLAGWVLSMVRTAIQYYKFELSQDGDRLVRSYGLIQHVELVVPLRRIQMLRLESNWLQRRLGHGRLYAETAGSAVEAEQGGSTMLTPMTPLSELPKLLTAVEYPLDLRTLEWRPLSRLALWKGTGWMVGAALLLAFLLREQSWWPWALAISVPAAVLYARAAYRVAGYALTRDLILYRSGLWRQSTFAVPRAKLQTCAVTEGPLQQRYGVADLQISTAASGGRAVVSLGDIPLEDAQRVVADFTHFRLPLRSVGADAV